MRLISSVTLDIEAFPLCLPSADNLNSGGYLLPNSTYAYSPIDLLIAGLEADRLGLVVSNLANFYDKHRFILADTWVYLTLEDKDVVKHLSICAIKTSILEEQNSTWLRVMQRNAPLSFKFIRLGEI
jgi:hypothetical protein